MIKKLDDRAKEKNSPGGFKAKQRQLSTPLLLSPPSSAPSWAVYQSHWIPDPDPDSASDSEVTAIYV